MLGREGIRMETIICRPGYRGVYGEVTKWATEASVFALSSEPIARAMA
jgi:hypothetical protein